MDFTKATEALGASLHAAEVAQAALHKLCEELGPDSPVVDEILEAELTLILELGQSVQKLERALTLGIKALGPEPSEMGNELALACFKVNYALEQATQWS